MKSKQDMIDNIMDNFNFNRVAKCMEVLEWKWCDVEGIPEESDIRKLARKLMKQVPDTFRKEEYYSGTGGLYVRAWYENMELVLIELTFVVAGWIEDVAEL